MANGLWASSSLNVSCPAVLTARLCCKARSRWASPNPIFYKNFEYNKTCFEGQSIKYFGGGTRVRTGEWRFCKPLPYHLAIPPRRLPDFTLRIPLRGLLQVSSAAPFPQTVRFARPVWGPLFLFLLGSRCVVACRLAERERFELSLGPKPHYRISNPAPSATWVPLRIG